MTEERKKRAARAVREFYLYPYRSKGENLVRGGAWMASWLIGIVAQATADQRTLGGAYFIFAISLLLEFVLESKRNHVARIIHAFFCFLLLVVLLGSFLLIFVPEIDSRTPQHWIYQFLATAPSRVGWIIFIMLLIGVALALVEPHKLFYDEEAETEHEKEAEQKALRDKFLDNLNGIHKGGNTQ